MNRHLIYIGPLAAMLLFLLLSLNDWSTASAVTASVTLLCATWWVFEPVPIPFTSLIPLAVFPLLGVLTPAQVGQSFGSPLILLLLILSVCLSVTFLTEVTSNTATASLLMPILAVTASATGLSPTLLMVPAVLSASCAFMLPVATAPNAIVFGSGKVCIREMAHAGFVLNLVGAVVITAVCLLMFE